MRVFHYLYLFLGSTYLPAPYGYPSGAGPLFFLPKPHGTHYREYKRIFPTTLPASSDTIPIMILIISTELVLHGPRGEEGFLNLT